MLITRWRLPLEEHDHENFKKVEEHGPIPKRPDQWPFGYQTPVYCKQNFAHIARTVVKQLVTSTTSIAKVEVDNSFAYLTGILRVVNNIGISVIEKPISDNSQSKEQTSAKVLISSMYGTDISELTTPLKKTKSILTMSNPTGMLLGTDQKKFLNENQNKLQLGLAKEITTNGFNCNFKPQRNGFTF